MQITYDPWVETDEARRLAALAIRRGFTVQLVEVPSKYLPEKARSTLSKIINSTAARFKKSKMTAIFK